MKNFDTSRNGLVVTVTSPTQDVGKSTVAVLTGTTIAHTSKRSFDAGLSERPLSVVIVELQIANRNLGLMMEDPTPSDEDIARSRLPEYAETIEDNLIYNDAMGIHGLTLTIPTVPYTDSDLRFSKSLPISLYRNTIQRLKTMFDVVIIDTSYQHIRLYDDVIKALALPEANAILLVTTMERDSVERLSSWMNSATAPISIDGFGVDKSQIGVVINRTIRGTGISPADISFAAHGAPLLVGIPSDGYAYYPPFHGRRLEDLLFHPTIGPAYFKLAEKIIKPRGIKLLPLMDDKNIQ